MSRDISFFMNASNVTCRPINFWGPHVRGTLSLGESRSRQKPRRVLPRGSRSNQRSRYVPKPMTCWAFNPSPSLNIHLMQRILGTCSLDLIC
ncbi:hypothetical protein CR513_26606, partial [Mucuna pruriens]